MNAVPFNVRGKSPANPSRRATARVTNPMPVPTVCPHDGGAVHLVENSVIYGRHYGEWPWAYRCAVCKAYVGLHPFTSIPLGTLATKPIREARLRAHAAFDPLWQDGGAMTRSQAYTWLASAIGIANVQDCHISWFDEAKCDRVVRAVKDARIAEMEGGVQ